MNPQTRAALAAYFAQVAELNDVSAHGVNETFTIKPSVQQTLEGKIQESADFLKRINVIGVERQEGEKLLLGVGKPIASRTDTTVKDRETKDVHTLDANKYRCEQTNFDTHIRFALLDAWAQFPDFQKRVQDYILRQIALDRIMIGFNGKRAAADSNSTENALLQDVNIGWLESIRLNAEQRYMKEVVESSGKVKVGASGDYKNIDALVMDAVSNLMDPWFRTSTDLVVMVGSKLLDDKYFPIVNQVQAPTEQLAAQIITSQRRIGNLPAATVPFLPENTVLITQYENLSLYYQKGAARRAIEINSKRDRIENYQSSNDAYVVEDFGCAALIDNIEIVN